MSKLKLERGSMAFPTLTVFSFKFKLAGYFPPALFPQFNI